MLLLKLAYRYLLIISVCSVLSGCSLLLKNNYGYNELSDYNESEYEEFISAFDPTDIKHFKSSDYQYKQFIELGSDSARKKDLNQPVQILYFNDSILLSYHANCYAKGTLSGLDWNYENRFDQFPPASAIESSLFDLSLLEITNIYDRITPTKKYTVLVFWSWMLEGVSKDAISSVLDNRIKNGSNENCEVILINTDAYWSEKFKEN